MVLTLNTDKINPPRKIPVFISETCTVQHSTDSHFSAALQSPLTSIVNLCCRLTPRSSLSSTASESENVCDFSGVSRSTFWGLYLRLCTCGCGYYVLRMKLVHSFNCMTNTHASIVPAFPISYHTCADVVIEGKWLVTQIVSRYVVS